MDYTYNQETENLKGGFVHALEVLEAIKISSQINPEVPIIFILES